MSGGGTVAGGAEPAASRQTAMQRLLNAVERVGNKVPHPVMIFVYLIIAVVVLSHLLYAFRLGVTYEVINIETDEVETRAALARSLLTLDGIRLMFTGMVPNFMAFNAVGVIIVAMLGVGIAEESGLVRALIKKLVAAAPAGALTYILAFVGILSSIAADAGYLVLIPLAAAAYISVGRHPLAGLALGFSSVAAAFLVNMLIVPTDAILTEITNDAIHLLDANRSIGLAANAWFSIGSVVMLVIVIGLINDRVVEPRLGPYAGEGPDASEGRLTPEEQRGLRFALYGLLATLAFIALLATLAFIALLTVPPGAPLRHPETGAIIGASPFMNSLIVSIALIFGISGGAFGIGAGTLKDATAIIGAMQNALASLAGLILLLFVIAQFLAFFNYSNMATLAAVGLAGVLKGANLPAIWLLVGFIVVTFVVDLIITGAVAKWALFAPIFIPLLMKLAVDPEVVLAAYRVSDSPMNAITPLNAYFALIVTFAQRYQKNAGVGTVIALMLPHVATLCVVWTLFFAAWFLLGLPWGL
jgi:aminobenzoyl-glutamate transport protein